MTGSKLACTPLDSNVKLTTAEVSEAEGLTDDKVIHDRGIYQSLIGRLLYLTLTRPDISFVVQTLSLFMHQPKKSHINATLRVVRYIKRQHELGILIRNNKSRDLKAYCDAYWASCPNTRQSVTGFPIKHGDSLISWKSKKQTRVS